MTADELIDEFRSIHDLVNVDPYDFKIWAQERLQKYMLKPLFISVGKGGGQTYKTMFEVYDSRNNRNRQCYFYNQNNRAIRSLIEDRHLTLQNWIDDPNPDLIINK